MKNKGFTLLFSLIVISILLSVGLAVFGIAYREIILSGSGRESQKAFYAADTGAECILYWDINRDVVTTTPPAVNIDCAQNTVAVGGALISSFEINLPDGSCSSVTIDKSVPGSTVVESLGYNMDCSSDSIKKVERGLRVTY